MIVFANDFFSDHQKQPKPSCCVWKDDVGECITETLDRADTLSKEPNVSTYPQSTPLGTISFPIMVAIVTHDEEHDSSSSASHLSPDSHESSSPMFFSGQFCDVAKMVIIHKKI
jgi:hypothetical protein